MSVNYCTDFICTYKKFDNDEDSNNLFRSQYLQAFNLDFFDLDIINDTCEKIYYLIKKYEENKLNKILAGLYNKHAKQLLPFSFKKNTYTNIFTFQILFSYDLFDMLHLCLIDLINNHNISDLNYDNLISSINLVDSQNNLETITQ
jgi:hypothetical protein